MEMIRLAFALIGAAIMLAVIVIAIFGRDDDRLNEGLLIGIYVGTFGSISVLFVLRYWVCSDARDSQGAVRNGS